MKTLLLKHFLPLTRFILVLFFSMCLQSCSTNFVRQIDITSIEGLVYKDFLINHPQSGQENEFSAFFFETHAKTTEHLRFLYNQSFPRIELNAKNAIYTEQGLVDRATKGPAKLFWARIESISRDEAVVNAGYYISPQDALRVQYHLRMVDSAWVIVSRDPEVVS